MDYKEKYEDALEYMRTVYPTLNGAAKEDVEHYFPELKENEDEKMINFISHELACLRATDEKGSDRYNELTEAIAWLKKQDERINVDSILNKVGIKSAYKDGNAWCILYGNDIQDGICGFGDTKEESLINFLKDLLEKQSEQETLCDKCRKEHPSHSCQDITELGRCAVEYEQKPAEWNEEDDKMFDNVIQTERACIDDCDVDDVGQKARLCYEKEITWLKSLKQRIKGE